MTQYKNNEQEKIDQVNEAAVAYGIADNNNVFFVDQFYKTRHLVSGF